MSRICLITPGHLSTNPRLVKEAEALGRAGHEVLVISARYLAWGTRTDRSCTSPAWQWAEPLPFGPLAPWVVRLRHAAVVRAARALWRLGARHHRVATAAWHPLCGDLIRRARRTPADLYIAHYPAALPAAGLAARTHHARYGFDAEDFHLGDPPEAPRHNERRALNRAIETRWLPGASHLTAASEGIADAYVAAYGIRRPVVVRNVFPLSQAPARPTPHGWAEPGPSVYWFSQTIGPDRGLECALRAIAISRSRPHLHLRGFLNPTYWAQLEALASSLSIADRLHVHEPAPPEQMERLAASYDLGLVSETGATPNRRIALTNKLFTYVLAGLPALISDIPAHIGHARQAGEAVRLFRTENPTSLAARLDELLLDPNALARARQAAHRLGQEELNWEKEQISLLRLIQLILPAQGDMRRIDQP